MITIKNSKLLSAGFVNAFGALYNNPELRAPVALRILKVAKLLDAEMEAVRALIKAFPEEVREEKQRELLEADAQFDVERIPMSRLGDIKIAPALLGEIEPFFDLES